jgi:general secretion pathway protein H
MPLPSPLRLTPAGRAPRPVGPAGFTLLELLVVMVILSLLLTTVPPLLSKAIPGAELRGAARELVAGLRQARGQAIASGRDVALALDLEARWFRVEGAARKRPLPAAIGLRLTTAESALEDRARGRIRFYPDGSSSGGRITLAGAGQRRVVEVDWLTGRVTLHD